MAACCLYGAFVVSLFLQKYELLDLYKLSDRGLEGDNLPVADGDAGGFERVDGFHIGGMTCTSCAQCIEAGLENLEGVRRARVNHLLERAEVAYTPLHATTRDIVAAVEALGFAARVESKGDAAASRRASWNHGEAFTLGVLLIVPILLLESLPPTLLASHSQQLYVLILSGLVQFVLGLPFHRRAVLHVVSAGIWHPPMDVLVSVATNVAYFASVFAYVNGDTDSFAAMSASLVLVTSLGKHLESYSRTAISETTRAFVDLVPTHAQLFPSGHTIPRSLLREGDLVQVGAGDRFPCDGSLLAPDSTLHAARLEVDESFQTGEAQQVTKELGDICLAGTVNSSLQVAVVRAPKVSLLLSFIVNYQSQLTATTAH